MVTIRGATRARVVLLFLLALPMVLAAVSAAAADNVVTVKLWTFIGGTRDPDCAVNQVLRAKTGVQMDTIITENQDMKAKLPLILASGDLPEAIITGDIWDDLYNEKVLVPVDKYFKDPVNYPNLARIPEEILAPRRMPDGKLYEFPAGNWQSVKFGNAQIGSKMGGWMVRTDLLKKLGMKESDLSTLAGVENYLRKTKGIKDAEGNVIIPFGTMFEDVNKARPWKIFASLFGIPGSGSAMAGFSWVQSGGKWIPEYQMPQYLTMFRWLNKMYREGLMDVESVAMDQSWYREKLFQGRYAMMFDAWGMLPTFWDKYKDTKHIWYTAVPTPKAPGVAAPGQYEDYNPWGGPMGLGITTAAKNPDAIARWADYLMSTEGDLIATFGEEGFNWHYNAKGEIEATDNWNKFWSGDAAVQAHGAMYWYWQFGRAQGDWIVKMPHPAEFTAVQQEYRKNDKIRVQDLSWGLQPAWARVRVPPEGAVAKYQVMQKDLLKQFWAKMIMAPSQAAVDQYYKDFLKAMTDRGHDTETIAEFTKALTDFMSTPAGQVNFDVHTQDYWYATSY